ncbi:beta-glucosidase family protein [Abyssalbus ytuae]|uniref:Glycoside hydrolase family 3 C-terminal domain-containing protein n=1 Tax=Abyssalbus ytuae TaxID=2926907 RepID=A0A9E6ZKR9_9FLAO|nr:glycoside hydrolase family 3 N-terminal domain-containing protein [Abyssalbus ytuae]UOB16025.1 glycoside hydrolase family 3 C-terminal domain-containing protein [Abyssalbus ytuae]
MKKAILFLSVLISLSLYSQKNNSDVQELIKQLSLEEKVYLVIGTGMDIPGISQSAQAPQATVGVTKNKVPGAAGTSYQIKKLDMPAIVFADGPAGIRISPTRENLPGETFYATAFPTATALSSTWHLDLVTLMGKAFGNEGKEYGIDFLLAPALNIHRNPLGGRNFEYYSEDPVLSGKIAAAFVKGVQSEGIGATIKHFVANNSETNRMALNTIVGERALREIYLRGFKIAIDEGKPWAVMSSYNKINGTYASENHQLLTNLLRDEWKYEGFVMTDWFAGKDAVSQMKAGNDLLMPGTEQQAEAILNAVKEGRLKEDILDRNIENILRQYLKTPSFKNYKSSNKPDLEANKTLARNIATEGMVLLKNEGILPFKNTLKVALLGVTSYETIAGGTGSGDVNKAYMVSLEEGFMNAGFDVDELMVNSYKTYIEEEKGKIPPKKFFFEPDVLVREKLWTEEELYKIADENDVAVFTLGRTSGEFKDRTAEADFYLTDEEKNILKQISEAFHNKGKKFVIILNIGGVIETACWKNLADAILLAWQPGQEAGNAIVDVLSGKVTPSGKLPVTFPIMLNDVYSSKNFPGKLLDPSAPAPENPLMALPSEEIYEEGIYVGYRYFDTFKVKTSYPFGFGLSYTSFEYSDLSVKTKNDGVEVAFNVKNTGKYAGKEIAQVYVISPKGKIEKPEKELKGFAKTNLLNPGKSESVKIFIKNGELAYYNDHTTSWNIDRGDYHFLIGSNSQDISLTVNVKLKEMILKKTGKLLSPERKIKELKQ